MRNFTAAEAAEWAALRNAIPLSRLYRQAEVDALVAATRRQCAQAICNLCVGFAGPVNPVPVNSGSVWLHYLLPQHRDECRVTGPTDCKAAAIWALTK